ncbi:sulfate permease family protein [Parvularcula bermudensis HTCC2503]|uniref:Sulfate permease family protein n=1 Tax=Parvularcula bermudensis (strain ATCC BAA-594 / HTCC2503 / KCTC 12087) TaxID=314260 RepID=E0THL0_PARBH|nr:SulP family inorganic anion transporter [Parvularcula bermudensis]ADM09306.1 sulfate permease family protein [Parvularcula bermudensis HTCC2503]
MKPKLLTTLPTTTRASLTADILAGITVALVALPLSIAIAIASGAAPETGLVTAIVAGFLISALGGSRVQIGGPTGAFIVVVAGVIAVHGYDGLVLATFMAGGILLIASVLRIGSLVEWVPEPVVDGFTVGIAIIIATSQLVDALGLTIQHVPAEFLAKLPVIWAARETLSLPALSITLLTSVLIISLRRLAPRLPGLIIAVALASIVAGGMNGIVQTPVETIVSRFGALASGLPAPHLPSFSMERVREMLPSALVIAFLAGIESLLSAVVADRMIGGKHRPNAEILAQGAANLGSALFGGLPATGAIARTATNVRSGGRTPIAGITHAVILLLIALFAAPIVGRLAMPALAALLILTAWNMSEPHRWPARLSKSRSDFALFALTLALTVLTDLTVAIAVGTGVGLALRLRRRNVSPTDWPTPKR